MKTLNDIISKNNDANRYNLVRHNARQICKKLPQICSKCGYSHHVEVHHIKNIKDFSLESTLEEINHPSNLMLLCPNCHWEIDNLHKKITNFCKCGKKIWKTSTECRKCSSIKMGELKRKAGKIPTKEVLLDLVFKFPMTELGKRFKVSDNTVKKWCKYYQIDLGNRMGYWRKLQCQRTDISG